MYPTADTLFVMLRQSIRAAGDAGRWAANLNLQIMLGIMPSDVL
jgi:hypothetical protein